MQHDTTTSTAEALETQESSSESVSVNHDQEQGDSVSRALDVHRKHLKEKLQDGETAKKDREKLESKVLTAPRKMDRTKPVKFLFWTLPDIAATAVYTIMDGYYVYRFNALKVIPAFIVNNSSNAIGATQLVGEAMYFKSSGVNQFIKDEHKGTWKAFVFAPVNVVEGVFKKASFGISPKDILNPKRVGQEIVNFFQLGKASEIDYAHDKARLTKLYTEEVASIHKNGVNASALHKELAPVANRVSQGAHLAEEILPLVEKNAKLSNRWSARSGFCGMMSMAIATVLPEEKDRPDQVEKMAVFSKQNPLGYIGYRLGKGMLFPILTPIRLVQDIFDRSTDHHLGDGKREFAGIGMTLTGLFSVLAGFRQPRMGEELVLKEGAQVLKKVWKYAPNPWQALGGAITTFAGSQLLLGISNQQGWTNYGGFQLLRLSVLPQSIKERFPDKKGFGDPNAKYYFGAQAAFQFKNIVAITTGGARKLEDGRLIDQQVKPVDTQASPDKPQETLMDATPKTTLSKVNSVTKAMPDRVERHAAGVPA